jgi:hypothetical protein
MIISHLPANYHIIDFPPGESAYRYLCAIPEQRRVIVAERATKDRTTGYREVAEMSETNLYMLAPAWQIYVRRWWEKWGI